MDFNKIAKDVLDTEANELKLASENISDIDLERLLDLIVSL